MLNKVGTLILGLVILSYTAMPVHATTPANAALYKDPETDGETLTSEARLELDSLLNEPYRSPAVLGPATAEPTGENARLYSNATDASDTSPDSPTFDSDTP